MINVQSRSIKTEFVFSWYQRVEYIQSSWSQYIDTWISANQYLSFEAEFTALWTITDSPLFWARTGSTTGRFWLIVYNAHFLMIIWNVDAASFYDTPVDTNKHTWSVFYNSSNFLATIDWKTSTVAVSTSALVNQNFWLFDYNYWTVAACPMRLYSFKLYTWSSNLVRDFYPVYRKSDNVIWLLDIVNKQFYTNAWSWTFIKWPDL